MTNMERAVRTKLYIAGPMTGRPEYNFPAFFVAEEWLTAYGYAVENPARTGLIDGYSWTDYMRSGITQLMRCDGVALLKGWGNSRGARLEVDIARSLDMDVRLLNAWLPS